jgi:hypothetical protein
MHVGLAPLPRDLHYGKQMQEPQVEEFCCMPDAIACAIHGEKSHVQHTPPPPSWMNWVSQLYPQFPGFRTLQGSSHYATCCCCYCCLLTWPQEAPTNSFNQLLQDSLIVRLPHNRSFPRMVLVCRYYFFSPPSWEG